MLVTEKTCQRCARVTTNNIFCDLCCKEIQADNMGSIRWNSNVIDRVSRRLGLNPEIQRHPPSGPFDYVINGEELDEHERDYSHEYRIPKASIFGRVSSVSRFIELFIQYLSNQYDSKKVLN